MSKFPLSVAVTDSAAMPITPPHAVMFGPEYFTGSVADRLVSATNEFAPVLSNARVVFSHFVEGWYFGVVALAEIAQTPVFTTDHPRRGTSRYTWYQIGESDLYYGFKVAGADTRDAAPVVEVVEEIAKIVEADTATTAEVDVTVPDASAEVEPVTAVTPTATPDAIEVSATTEVPAAPVASFVAPAPKTSPSPFGNPK